MHHAKEKYIRTGYAQGSSTQGTMPELSGMHNSARKCVLRQV